MHCPYRTEHPISYVQGPRADWVDAGGIVGRGVLIDWVAYLEAVSKDGPRLVASQDSSSRKPLQTGKAVPHALSHHEISPADLDAVLAHQGTTLQPGDILLVRSGFVRWHNGASSDERKAAGEAARYTGVEASEAMKAWLWERQCSAVAGDAVAFEGGGHGEELQGRDAHGALLHSLAAIPRADRSPHARLAAGYVGHPHR